MTSTRAVVSSRIPVRRTRTASECRTLGGEGGSHHHTPIRRCYSVRFCLHSYISTPTEADSSQVEPQCPPPACHDSQSVDCAVGTQTTSTKKTEKTVRSSRLHESARLHESQPEKVAICRPSQLKPFSKLKLIAQARCLCDLAETHRITESHHGCKSSRERRTPKRCVWRCSKRRPPVAGRSFETDMAGASARYQHQHVQFPTINYRTKGLERCSTSDAKIDTWPKHNMKV